MIFFGALEDCSDPLIELPIVCSLPSTAQSLIDPFRLQLSSSQFLTPLQNPIALSSPAPCCCCSSNIYDKTFLLIGGDSYHEDCAKCAACQESLMNEATCFFKDNHLWCRRDYLAKYGLRCNRCLSFINNGEYFINVRNTAYHAECFVCFVCNRPFRVGDRYVLVGNGIAYCESHSSAFGPPEPIYLDKLIPQSDPAETEAGKTSPIRSYQRLKANRRSQNESTLTYMEGTGDDHSEEKDTALSGTRKTKRMRTSFKHHQLKTMKTYFNLNQNPDAKDLKQLAQKTGLTKRVLQVWFQNARAKHRRSQQGKDRMSNDFATTFQDNFSNSIRDSASPGSSTPMDNRSLGSVSPEAQSDDSCTRMIKSEYL
ncbi:unnamed protein product [Bursaphelenchus xylophilus]|uniref:(pine wood nematode) hypothetical protein n=1 Tax=Bursaphelenchus xylophilus TaxID=6326 RepID=A0A1I7SMV1_BURXY|nr:unnamed protein product [Bursaphelenchus xylophilus]CAG9130397.1 unnamed protein product [Bursaphelenchus xylophilus]